MQIVNHANSNTKILATAPSNSAADNIAQLLLQRGCSASRLFRVNAYSRGKVDYPPALNGVSNFSKLPGVDFDMEKETIKRARTATVVVTTW
jgi:hypothetical protein